MKQIFLVITTIIFIAGTAMAQDESDYRDKLLFGFKVGANYSNVYDTKGEEFQADPKIGLATGIFLSIPIGKFIGIQPELLFSQKGFQATGRLLGTQYKFTRTTNYIDVPLLFSVKPHEFITILAGPQYSYLLKQTDKYSNGTITNEQEQEFNNDNIRRNTLGFTGGIDINIKNLVLSGRVGWDILHNNGDGSSATPRYKNVSYQATIGYRFL